MGAESVGVVNHSDSQCVQELGPGARLGVGVGSVAERLDLTDADAILGHVVAVPRRQLGLGDRIPDLGELDRVVQGARITSRRVCATITRFRLFGPVPAADRSQLLAITSADNVRRSRISCESEHLPVLRQPSGPVPIWKGPDQWPAQTISQS